MTPFLRRWGIALFVVLSLTGAGVADRLAPASPPLPAAVSPPEPGHTWSCPFVKPAGSPGWLHLANFGAEPARIRVTYLPDRRGPVVQAFELGADRAGTIGTPSSIRAAAAGAIVEYAGGNVVVSRTSLFGANGGSGGVAAACSLLGPQALVVPEGSTLRVETQLIILNPGTSDAVVDVSLAFDGQILEPESLRGRVVPARGRLVIREGDFAFDEPIVVAVIRSRSGRIAAEGLMSAAGLIELVPAVGAAGEVVAIGHTAQGVDLSGVTIGDVDALAEGRTLSLAGQGVFEPLVGGLPPNTPRSSGVPPDTTPPGPVAVTANSSTAPVALAARWRIIGRGGLTDQAITSGAQPGMSAAAVLGTPAGELRLLIANPGERDTTISVTVVTEAGRTTPGTLQSVTIEAGHTAELRLSGLGGQGTVGVLIGSAETPIAAAIQGVAVRPSFGGYAVMATPELPRPTVAVDPDPRAGVPA